MTSLKTLIHTVWIWLMLAVLIVLISLPLLVFLLLPERFLVKNRGFIWLSRFFYWYCITFCLFSISYKGTQHLLAQPCIIVANHQSSFDIPLIGYILKDKPHIWLAWAQLQKLPLLKPFIQRVALLVDVSSSHKAARAIVESIAVLNMHPWDLILFPEGGRYTDEKVHPFYSGFAIIARKTQRPVIPINITGVNKVYPPNTWVIQEYPINVEIGPPFILEKDESDDAFKQRVYQWFIGPQEK